MFVGAVTGINPVPCLFVGAVTGIGCTNEESSTATSAPMRSSRTAATLAETKMKR
jgi:hypothetical protein